tara:strand:+ start:1501 stop:1785 length:285 start_codon:yes stop_codon:yes gene_type:complete
MIVNTILFRVEPFRYMVTQILIWTGFHTLALGHIPHDSSLSIAKPNDMTPMKPSNPTDSGSRPMKKAMTVRAENPSEHKTDSTVIITWDISVFL